MSHSDVVLGECLDDQLVSLEDLTIQEQRYQTEVLQVAPRNSKGYKTKLIPVAAVQKQKPTPKEQRYQTEVLQVAPRNSKGYKTKLILVVPVQKQKSAPKEASKS